MQHADIFAQRRRTFLNTLGPNDLALFFSAPEQTRNGDVTFPYRQDSDFYYLSGFAEPHSVLVFAPARAEGEYVIINRAADPKTICWDGAMAGQAGACEFYGADQAFDIATLTTLLPELMRGRTTLHVAVGAETDAVVHAALTQLRAEARNGERAPETLVDVRHTLAEMRLIKSEFEMTQMRTAATISAQAHRRAMQQCQPGMKEYELEAELMRTFYQHGSRFPAYSSIVGGGENACTLHYVANDSILCDDTLVLIDAGAEYNYYASDITRTFPVNGRFNDAQRAVYEQVLACQEALIAAVRPGVTWDTLQTLSVQLITESLVTLGLLQGDVEQLIAQQAYTRFYMHRFGHWLGMDVHDVGEYTVGAEQAWRPLKAGMVLTVEPGIYIRAADDVPSAYHNIGIRIEDDILVTEQGCEVLSEAAPKSVAEIEACMQS